MAYGTTPAGTITKEQTLLSTRRLPVAASTNVVKGNVCSINSSGYVVVATSSTAAGSPWFVALANADNSSGAAGDISVPLAAKGHFVTVVADGTINAGEGVKIGSTAGKVVGFVEGTDAEGLKVGYYIGKEGGSVSKAGSTPYLESFTDNADFLPVAAASGNVIEVLVN